MRWWLSADYYDSRWWLESALDDSGSTTMYDDSLRRRQDDTAATGDLETTRVHDPAPDGAAALVVFCFRFLFLATKLMWTATTLMMKMTTTRRRRTDDGDEAPEASTAYHSTVLVLREHDGAATQGARGRGARGRGSARGARGAGVRDTHASCSWRLLGTTLSTRIKSSAATYWWRRGLRTREDTD